jgi:hypothetical protein
MVVPKWNLVHCDVSHTDFTIMNTFYLLPLGLLYNIFKHMSIEVLFHCCSPGGNQMFFYYTVISKRLLICESDKRLLKTMEGAIL